MRRYRGRKAIRELTENLLARYDLDVFVIQWGMALTPPLAKTVSGAAPPAGGAESAHDSGGGGIVASTGLPGINRASWLLQS